MQNIFIRAVLLYLACLLVMRIMGKRQIGQLQPFELVISFLVAQLAASPMGDSGIPLIYGLVPLFAILVMHQLISYLMMKSSRFRACVCGKPALLIQKGKVQEVEMKKQMLNMEDLISQLRAEGFVRIKDIESAVLEPNGQLSVLPVATAMPATPSDLKIKVSPVSMPISLIIDGKVYHENLQIIGHNVKWLEKQLDSQNLSAEKTLLALYYTSTNELHVQPKMAIKAVS